MVDQPDKRAAYNDSAVRISANQIPDRPLLAQSGHSYANSTSRLIRNKRPYQLGIRLGGGGATALTFRLAIRTANALLREKP